MQNDIALPAERIVRGKKPRTPDSEVGIATHEWKTTAYIAETRREEAESAELHRSLQAVKRNRK